MKGENETAKEMGSAGTVALPRGEQVPSWGCLGGPMSHIPTGEGISQNLSRVTKAQMGPPSNSLRFRKGK